MNLIFYFLTTTYIQIGYGDSGISSFKPPEPLSVEDVQTYVLSTSKMLEELAKEHLWLLSIMTGTNNWKDILGDGKQLTQEKEGVPGEQSLWKEARPRTKDQDKDQDGGKLKRQGKEVDGKDEFHRPLEVQTEEDSSHTENTEKEVQEDQNADAGIADMMQQQQQQTTRPMTKDKSNSSHSHSQDHKDEKHPYTTSELKPDSTSNIGYTTNIGHEDQPDPTLNYLALRDAPIQHLVDPYGKPINKSVELQAEVSKPLATASPRVLQTKERDVVFAPLSISEPVVQTAGQPLKPSSKKTPSTTAVDAKKPVILNPLAQIYNDNQAKPDTTITFPKGVFNPLALESSYIDDQFNDIDNVVNHLLAPTNVQSDKNHLQTHEPVIDPLDFPVQYYKPEAVPSTNSKPPTHPAHHSRLEDNDIGW